MKGLRAGRGMKRTKMFVGRSRELSLMESWLDDSAALFQIFAITGMGGIGKSSLMAEMMRIAKERNALVVWLDGRSCTQTPAGFLEYLSATFRLETLDMSFSHALEPLVQAKPEQKVVLCIDNFDHIPLLEGWLLGAFIPKLPPSGVAMILTSRRELSLTWKMNTSINESLVEMPLTFLSFEETAAYIRSALPDYQDMVGRMARSSDGHPLALALAVESVLKHNGKAGLDNMVLSQTISSHILKELTSSELQPMIDALIVLQYANQEMLSLMIQRPVTLGQYQALQEISFIQTGPDGLVLHDLARIHLLRDFRLREPRRLNEMRRKAAAILNRQLSTADRGKRRMIASQMLRLSKDVFRPTRLYADITVDYIASPMETFQPDDLPALRELLSSWCEYSVDPWQCGNYHEFLDDLAVCFPESIAVLRGKDKKPIAMFIAVLLYAETSQFLMKYFPSEIQSCCKPQELLCERNKADTYYAVLGAATNSLSSFTREELVGLVTLDRLSLLGEGARGVMVVTNQDLKLFLKQIGFNMRPAQGCNTSYASADVLEIDLRNNSFGSWIASFFKENPEQSMPPSTTGLTEKEIRKLLSSLHSPSKLQHFASIFPGMGSGLELQNHILSLLTSPAAGLSEQDRKLLHFTYYIHANNRIAAMHECSMSRATFYRYLNKAISNFSEYLKDR